MMEDRKVINSTILFTDPFKKLNPGYVAESLLKKGID